LLGTSILAHEPRHPRAELRRVGPGFAAGDYAFGDLATIGGVPRGDECGLGSRATGKHGDGGERGS
jgi:hypothetical protein